MKGRAGRTVRRRASRGGRGGGPYRLAPGEVPVAMEAATVNPADAAVVSAATPRFERGAVGPYTPGWDLAGTIIACGDGVSESLVRSWRPSSAARWVTAPTGRAPLGAG